MSYGRDKTKSKRQRELERKYFTSVSDKIANDAKKESYKKAKYQRESRYNEYLKLIEIMIKEGKSVEEIYVKIKPFMIKEFGLDPRAIIEWKAGKKIEIENQRPKKVDKDDFFDNR